MKEVNLETITDTQSGYKILPPNGFNLIRAKQRLYRRRKRVCKSFSSRQTSQTLLVETIHRSLGNLVKVYHGTIELQHLIDPRVMALLKEPYEDSKKELQQYCYNQDWVKSVG